MSKGFTFEKNLPHQKAGVDAVMNVFVSAIPHQTDNVAIRLLSNPELNLSEQQYYNNIKMFRSSMVLSIQKIITMLKATSLTFLWRQGRVKPIPTQNHF